MVKVRGKKSGGERRGWDKKGFENIEDVGMFFLVLMGGFRSSISG